VSDRKGTEALLKAVNSRRSHGFLAAVGVFWGSLLVVGFLLLAQEEFTPVKASLPVTLFPRSSAVRLVSNKLTLVLFAHPHCPCTRASLHELDRLLAETQNRVSVTVVFTIPDGVPVDWEQGDCGTRRPGCPAFVLLEIKGAGKRANLRSRVQDMSCCMTPPGSYFSAEESPHLVDMKATMWAAPPS